MQKGLYDYVAGPYLILKERPIRRVELIDEHDGIVTLRRCAPEHSAGSDETVQTKG